MNEEPYLWDQSEPVAPFVEKLERLLAEKRAVVKAAGRRPKHRIFRVVGLFAASIAAAVAVWAFSWRGEDEVRSAPQVAPPIAESPVPPQRGADEPQAVDAQEAEKTENALAFEEPAKPEAKPEVEPAHPAAEETGTERVLIRSR